MKANYENEDYKSDTQMKIIISIIVLFPIIWLIATLQHGIDVSIIILGLFFIIPLGILDISTYRERKKKINERNKNLYIMKNGEKQQSMVPM